MADIIYCGNMLELINLTNIIKENIYKNIYDNAYNIATFDMIKIFYMTFIAGCVYVSYVTSKPKKNTPIIISIEGNIGTGKSTFIDKIQAYFKRNNTDIKIGFIPEPVNIWNSVTDDAGITILEKYYGNQHKYAFPFQMMAYISRLAIMREVLKQDYEFIIMERSMFTDCEVFAKMLYDDKKIESIEYNIYKKWFNEFVNDFPAIFHIYIQADPKVSLTRVIKRARNGENIPLSYLEKCHEYHEKWLLEGENEPVLILDGNQDMNDSEYNKWLEQVEEFIRSDYEYEVLCT